MTIRLSTAASKGVYIFTTIKASISPMLFGSAILLATVLLALTIRFNKEMLQLPGSIFTLLAVVIFALLIPRLLRALRVVVTYRLEMDDAGISVFEGETTVFRETWQSIPQFVLGYSGHVVSLELYGTKNFKVWTGGLTSGKDEATLKAVINDIKVRGQLGEGESRSAWFMPGRTILRYPNPLFKKSTPYEQ